MALHDFSILNGFTVPDTSGNVFWEPYTVSGGRSVPPWCCAGVPEGGELIGDAILLPG